MHVLSERGRDLIGGLPGPTGSVFVVVAFVGSVAMSVVEVVEMSLVLHRLMPAIGTVFVGMLGVLDVREGMLVVMTAMLAVGVTVVDVVGVTFVVDRRVPAIGTVDVAVLIVDGVVGRAHVASFAWLTASATMCATW